MTADPMTAQEIGAHLLGGRPLFSLPVSARFSAARVHEGRRVELDLDPFRDGNVTTLTGELVAVATPTTGAQCDSAVLRRDGRVFAEVISLATVRAIRRF